MCQHKERGSLQEEMEKGNGNGKLHLFRQGRSVPGGEGLPEMLQGCVGVLRACSSGSDCCSEPLPLPLPLPPTLSPPLLVLPPLPLPRPPASEPLSDTLSQLLRTPCRPPAADGKACALQSAAAAAGGTPRSPTTLSRVAADAWLAQGRALSAVAGCGMLQMQTAPQLPAKLARPKVHRDIVRCLAVTCLGSEQARSLHAALTGMLMSRQSSACVPTCCRAQR